MQLDEPPENALPDQTAIATSDTAVQHWHSSWSVLRNCNYVLLFWDQLVSSTGTQMQIVAIAWQVFLLTHSAIALGLIGLFQAIPRILFSLIGGMFADAFDRRKLLLVIQIVLATLSAVLALCTFFHVVTLFIIYAVVLVAASVSAFDFPMHQAIIPNLVPRERVADAMPLYMMMIQLTGIVGPTVGGFVLAWLGIANIYWIDVISYVVVIGSLLFMTVPRISVEKRTQADFRALADGVRFLRTKPIVLAVARLFCHLLWLTSVAVADFRQYHLACQCTGAWHLASGRLPRRGRSHSSDWMYSSDRASRSLHHPGHSRLGSVYRRLRTFSLFTLAVRAFPHWSRSGEYGEYDSALSGHPDRHTRRISRAYQFRERHVCLWWTPARST